MPYQPAPGYGSPGPAARATADQAPPSDYIAGVPRGSNNMLLLLAVGGGALFVGILLVLVFVLLK